MKYTTREIVQILNPVTPGGMDSATVRLGREAIARRYAELTPSGNKSPNVAAKALLQAREEWLDAALAPEAPAAPAEPATAPVAAAEDDGPGFPHTDTLP